MGHHKHLQLMMSIPLMCIVFNVVALLPYATVRIVEKDIFPVYFQHLYVNFWYNLRIQTALIVTVLRSMALNDAIVFKQFTLQIWLIADSHNVIVTIDIFRDIVMRLFSIASLAPKTVVNVLVILPQSIVKVNYVTIVWNIIV